MTELRSVLFDLDGVLVDSYEAWFQLVNLTARAFCKPDVERERFQTSWGQGLEADLREFFPGCCAEDIARFYEEHLLDFDASIQVNADASRTLCGLRDAGVPRGIITNTPTLLARDILAWAGLIGMIDITIGASSDVAAKPAPDTILRACEVLGVEPKETVVIGDSHLDAQAAKAAKAKFIGFRTKKGRSVSSLSEVVDLVEHNHLKVPAPPLQQREGGVVGGDRDGPHLLFVGVVRAHS
ncbi:MAG: HAD family hydrolase, partial [Candidatus Krumholzibacteriia bacterium]